GARRLFGLLVQSFNEENVPMDNFVGFASDGCNTMFGTNNSVASRLQESYKGVIVNKCRCHSLHLCASEACKELPRCIEDLARNIYGIFKNSSKRQAEYAEFQEFYHTDPHKILRPSQTRWLSLQSVVNRILEQWDHLKAYFQLKVLDARVIAATNVLNYMNDPTTKQYYHFLQWALPRFVDLNELFQSDRPLITIVHKKMCAAYKHLILAFMDRAHVKRTPLDQINPLDTSKHIPLSNIYLGVKVLKGFSEPPISNHPDKVNMEKCFRDRCKAFLVKGCTEMRQRFDFNSNSPFARMACLSPAEAMSRTKEPTLLHLIETVPRICDPNDLDRVQQLDDQWQLLDKREFTDGMKEMEVDDFWITVRDYTDLDGKQIFKELDTFALHVLSLPHSNAACERCFSKINLIKTKIRNRMMTETLNGLLLASHCAKDGGGSDKFVVTQAMLAAMTAENLKPKKKPPAERPRGIADLDVVEEVDVDEVLMEEEFDVTFG
ncbi:Zinc finger protein 862, partial [Frankliniella fusca]